MAIPRTTHWWLQALYNVMEGKGVRAFSFGSPTGVIQAYGTTGASYMKQLATGTASLPGGSGGTGMYWFNGGSGTYYTPNDMALALKNFGILKP